MPVPVDYFLNIVAWGIRKEITGVSVRRHRWAADGNSNTSTWFSCGQW